MNPNIFDTIRNGAERTLTEERERPAANRLSRVAIALRAASSLLDDAPMIDGSVHAIPTVGIIVIHDRRHADVGPLINRAFDERKEPLFHGRAERRLHEHDLRPDFLEQLEVLDVVKR